MHLKHGALALALALLAPAATAQAHDHGGPPLTFGIYAGGQAGTPSGLTTGPADDPAKIQAALDRLQGGRRPFLVRAFTAFADQAPGTVSGTLPANAAQYATHGRRLDLVLGYSGTVNSQAGWIRWVQDQVHAYGPSLGAIQITEEPNILQAPGEDPINRQNQAVITGVLAADEQLRRDRLRHSVDIGISVAEIGIPDADFWKAIGRLATPRFRAALDYVGTDMYPGFLNPQGSVSDGLTSLLHALREQSLPLAGLGRVPIRVTENGWPTGPGRTEAQQVAAVQDGVRTVSALRGRLGITHYEFWDLRDADTAVADPWYQFGLLRSDYTPKPAFDTYRRLVDQFG